MQKFKIDLSSYYGKTYVRNEENVHIRVDIESLTAVGLKQGNEYPLTEFPEKVQIELLSALNQYKKDQEQKAKEDAELEAKKKSTRFSYCAGTKTQLFNPKWGKLRNTNPDLVLSYTGGGRYIHVFYKGYVENQNLRYFENAHELLSAVFGSRYNKGVITAQSGKDIGRIIGSGGSKIKAISKLVGFRLQVKKH